MGNGLSAVYPSSPSDNLWVQPSAVNSIVFEYVKFFKEVPARRSHIASTKKQGLNPPQAYAIPAKCLLCFLRWALSSLHIGSYYLLNLGVSCCLPPRSKKRRLRTPLKPQRFLPRALFCAARIILAAADPALKRAGWRQGSGLLQNESASEDKGEHEWLRIEGKIRAAMKEVDNGAGNMLYYMQ